MPASTDSSVKPAPQSLMNTRRRSLLRTAAVLIAIILALFLALGNLTAYPITWFDEGSHLHVPKTLVRFGVYADYSSEGFRYYGPTIGVGPTVILPIAAAFWLFGIGLLQARLVMALYLLATIFAFYHLANVMGGRRFAWVATILLVTCRSVALLSYGRQVLGEVPGFFFLVAGLALWFARWEKAGWRRLLVVGLLMGLAVVTKYQYLLFVAPALILAWLANMVYYRSAPQRVFLVPGVVAAACFGLWQVYLVLYLGPATAGENLTALREATAGAAMAFSPHLMQESLKVLFSFPTYLGSLLPALLYGVLLVLPRKPKEQQWGVLLLLVMTNLVWYVLASVGWWRYAFLGLGLASLFVARFFHDFTNGFRMAWTQLKRALREGSFGLNAEALSWVMLIWLAVMILFPLAETVSEIVSPGFSAPQAMADYMNENISQDMLVETWEPEMGFLTDHNYHFPPAELLAVAVSQASLGGPPVSNAYDFVRAEQPAYVLVGPFGRGVDLYPADLLASQYRLVTEVGGYELYELAKD
jgi:4-amino-4-deoxy-L-arabinose transferase-like glycosyltransferase